MELLLLLAVLPAAVVGQCFSTDDQIHDPDPRALRTLYKGQQEFAIELLNAVNKQTPAENVFLSPFSVYNVLMLAYFTASSKTEESLKKVLHLPETQDKASTQLAYRTEKFTRMARAINRSSDYELLSANRLFVSNKFTVRDCMKQLFTDEIVPTDFAADSSAAVNMINAWVANQTKNNIKDLFKPGQITPVTNLVLANAAYFKGLWKSKFSPDSTKRDLFYITTSVTTFVYMMKQKSTFNYLVSEKLGAHILEIPYKGDEVSIIFLLPPFTGASGVTNILERMKTNDFEKVMEELVQRQVEVIIPKFEIEVETNIVEPLKSLGVGDLFDSTADLSRLTGTNDIKLDDAIHKAKVSLDEEGTTAAAATAIFNFRSSRPLDPVKFNANHPFVYIIFDKISRTIVFSGVFNKPPSSNDSKLHH